MAIISLSKPPAVPKKKKITYRFYRKWLLQNFYFHICSYCLLTHDHIEIEHFEPKKYAPTKIHDPTNLLLGCGICNGPGGKSDYHPNHHLRRRFRKIIHGFSVIDVRSEDLSKLFHVDSTSGDLIPKNGGTHDRAAWNIVLLNLQIEQFKTRRKELLKFLKQAENLLELLQKGKLDSGVKPKVIEECLATLAGYIKKQLHFFRVFEISITPELKVYLEKI